MDITSYLLGKQAGGGGGDVSLQTNKSVTITSNGSTTVNPDEGYDAIKKVSVTTNVPTGADLNDYFNTTISSHTDNTPLIFLKKDVEITITNDVTSLRGSFADFKCGTTVPKLIGGTNVTTLGGLCNVASNITNVDLSGLTPNNLQKMGAMFQSCYNLTSVNFGNLDTSHVTDMSYMFSNCRGLVELDLSNFNTPALTNTNTMFSGCRNLQKLDMRNFTFNGIDNHDSMFGLVSTGVPSGCEIIVKSQTEKDWVLARRSDFTNVKTVAEL